MAISPLNQSMYTVCVPCEASEGETRFILVSTVVESTWNLELGCQGAKDRWWRGACPLPDAATQSELANRLPTGITQILGWREASADACMLKVVFDLSPAKKLRIPLKEYDPQIAVTRTMQHLFRVALGPAGRNISPLPSRLLQDISAGDMQAREQEHTIQELRRKIGSLEKALQCKSASVSETPAVAPRKIPTLPKGASLANPSKRRRVVKDMRFDGE